MTILTIIPPSAEIVAVRTVVDGGVSSPRNRVVGGKAAGPLGVVEQDGQAERLSVVVLHVGAAVVGVWGCAYWVTTTISGIGWICGGVGSPGVGSIT